MDAALRYSLPAQEGAPPDCSACKHVGEKQVRQLGGIAVIPKCNRTGCSAAWERAAMIQGDPPIQQFERGKTRFAVPLYPKDHSNCGPRGKFFERSI